MCFLALGVAPGAAAQDTAASSSAARAASSAPAPAPAAATALALNVQLNRSALEPEAIRKAVELELKRSIVLSSDRAESAQGLSVVVHPDHTVTVSYRAANGLTRTRSIGLPRDAARGAEVIALLSGNLSRDEASELLAALAAKAGSESTPAPVSTPAATPPAAPVPVVSGHGPALPAASTPAPLLATPFPLNFTLYSPLALYRDSPRRLLTAEVGLVYSHVGELHGLGVNAFVLHTERDVRGVSLATLYNRTDGSVTGFTSSAIVNRSRRVLGAEASGVLSLGFEQVQGLTVSGAANLQRDVLGVQAAGAFTRARHVEGLQLSGALNLAESVRGLQLGLVNVAGEVHGVQLGLVNVAKHVDGTSIGLVSVADNGRLQPVLWSSTLLPINAALKFTVGPLYSQAGLGYAPDNDTYSYELGLGAHLPIGRVFLEPGVHYSEMRSSKHPFAHELLEHAHYRLAAGYDTGPVAPFIGVAVLQRFAHSADAPSSDPVKLEGFLGAAAF